MKVFIINNTTAGPLYTMAISAAVAAGEPIPEAFADIFAVTSWTDSRGLVIRVDWA
jgi:hypothetical protein